MFIRVYSGEDGQSHFEEFDLPMAPLGWETVQATTGIFFSRREPGHFMDWHNASRRQYIIILSGQMEIGIGDGTVRWLGPGDVLLAEDLTGRGHTTRVAGSETRGLATVPLA